MTDRLRRLDALFAEKVLGCRVLDGRHCGCDQIDVVVASCRERIWPHGTTDAGYEYISQEVQRYTRSLDAAWSAPSRLLHEVEFNRLNETGLYKCHLRTDYNDDLVIGREWLHPAEALVLACLRAMGVPEEDLA